MNVPDGIVILALTQIAALGAYAFKKLLEFEKLRDTVRELETKQRRKKRK